MVVGEPSLDRTKASFFDTLSSFINIQWLLLICVSTLEHSKHNHSLMLHIGGTVESANH